MENNNNVEELKKKIRTIGEEVAKVIKDSVKIEDYEYLKSEMGDIVDIFAEGTPLTAGKILIKLAGILIKLDGEKYAGLIKDCYILSFQLAIEDLENMAKQKQKTIEDLTDMAKQRQKKKESERKDEKQQE